MCSLLAAHLVASKGGKTWKCQGPLPEGQQVGKGRWPETAACGEADRRLVGQAQGQPASQPAREALGLVTPPGPPHPPKEMPFSPWSLIAQPG